MTAQPVEQRPAIRLNQRQVGLGLIAMMTVAVGIILILQLFNPLTAVETAITVVAFLVLAGLLVAYWRGWRYAPYAVVISISLLGMLQQEPFLTRQVSLAILVAPVIALILAGPGWVLASGALVLGGLIIRAGGVGIYTDPFTIVIFMMVIGGMILARLVTDTAQHAAEANAARTEQALIRVEAQAAEVSRKAEELERQNEEQRRLIDLVATLEVTAVAIADGVLLAPVVGHLDSRRAAGLTDRLLHGVNATRARLVILDIAGVPAVDTAVAQALLRAIQAVRLLGCDVAITGISASIAATMTELGINMAGVRTARTPQEALDQALTAAPRIATNGMRRN